MVRKPPEQEHNIMNKTSNFRVFSACADMTKGFAELHRKHTPKKMYPFSPSISLQNSSEIGWKTPAGPTESFVHASGESDVKRNFSLKTRQQRIEMQMRSCSLERLGWDLAVVNILKIATISEIQIITQDLLSPHLQLLHCATRESHENVMIPSHRDYGDNDIRNF